MTPSSQLGLTPGSYEAYCLDQAVWYFGATLSSEIEKAGQKKQKGEAQIEAARKRTMNKYLHSGDPVQKGQYADPALLFGTS